MRTFIASLLTVAAFTGVVLVIAADRGGVASPQAGTLARAASAEVAAAEGRAAPKPAACGTEAKAASCGTEAKAEACRRDAKPKACGTEDKAEMCGTEAKATACGAH